MSAISHRTESIAYSGSVSEDTPSHGKFRVPSRPPRRRINTLLFGSQAPWDSCTGDDTFHHERFRLHDLQIDEEAICSGLDCHKSFKVKEGYEMNDLPKFNDMTRYGIDQDHERGLWEFEVHRLVHAAKSDKPIQLEGPDEWYGSTDSDGYNRLHVLGMAIKYALDVCIHDNELVMLEHQPSFRHEPVFARSYRSLLRAFDPEEGVILFNKQIKLTHYNDEAYHSLVNYVTAIIARILVRTLRGKFWVENCLSTLAKFASKLKVLADNLPLAVSRTIDAHNELRARTEKSKTIASRPDPLIASQAALAVSENGKSASIDLSALETSGVRYFVVMDCFNSGIMGLILHCIADLRWDEEVEQEADMFETSAVVYATGFRGSRIQLCQERDGVVGMGAERNLIHCAGVTFDVCGEVWSELPSVEGPPRAAPLDSSSPGTPTTVEETTLVWNWTPLTDDKEERLLPSQPGFKRTTSMRVFINAFVPYLMFCGSTPDQLSQFARSIIHISDTTNPVKFFKQQPYLASARIRTSQYLLNLQALSAKDPTAEGPSPPKHPRFQNVYDTPMAIEGALAGIEVNTSTKATLLLRKKHLATRDEYHSAVSKVESWVIDEHSIVITSLWYTWFVLAGIAVLILSGVGLISLRNGIDGVDPSNLTVLVWTSAGFLTVYFKSRRVENWPWRDFLRGRVVCRSVSEVQAVTKMDPQVLLAVLMRFESRVRLVKCGPFCSIFDRRLPGGEGGDAGFSIDVPPMNEAARAGGRIFVGVDTALGPALVGLEGRSRARYTVVDRMDSLSEDEGYICRDFVDPAEYRLMVNVPGGRNGICVGENAKSESLYIYPLCKEGMFWHRVKGVFVERALFG